MWRATTNGKKCINFFHTPPIVQLSIALEESSDKYAGKTVLITGGTSGIGLAIAKRYYSQGANVIITGRDSVKLALAKQEVQSVDKSVGFVDTKCWDLCDRKWREEIHLIFENYGGIDILVNNAGVYDTTPVYDMTEEIWDKIITTNLKAPYFVSQSYINEIDIRRKKSERTNSLIYNLLFIVSNRSLLPDTHPYGISKSGLLCFVKGLAIEAVKHGVIVNGISPGMTASNINGVDVSKNAYRPTKANYRVASAEEVAELAAYMTSKAARHMVGEVVVLDGGESL